MPTQVVFPRIVHTVGVIPHTGSVCRRTVQGRSNLARRSREPRPYRFNDGALCALGLDQRKLRRQLQVDHQLNTPLHLVEESCALGGQYLAKRRKVFHS